MKASDEEVLRFAAASFPSVWALELLLAMKEARRPQTREELVAKLRASELVVAKALDALVAAGLASTDGDTAVYLPASAEAQAATERLEQLYGSRPNAVRRAIVSAGASSAAAFADAFRLRRDGDD